jgi:hypothetical protein
MGLRLFHLVFISLSVMLAAFGAAWAVGQYRVAPGVGYVLTLLAFLAAGVGLALYGAAFQRRTKQL